jgi:hypothetical protein
MKRRSKSQDKERDQLSYECDNEARSALSDGRERHGSGGTCTVKSLDDDAEDAAAASVWALARDMVCSGRGPVLALAVRRCATASGLMTIFSKAFIRRAVVRGSRADDTDDGAPITTANSTAVSTDTTRIGQDNN